MCDFLENIPEELINELKTYGFSVGMKGTTADGKLSYVGSSSFIQKENKEAIKALKLLGWKSQRRDIRGGVKYISMMKHI